MPAHAVLGRVVTNPDSRAGVQPMSTATTSSTANASSGSNSYDRLTALLRENETLKSVSNVMSWDQETMMPPNGADLRADQLTLLSGMIHDRNTDPRLGDLLGEAETDAAIADDPIAQANLREARRDFDMATKLPKSLVEEMARCNSQGMMAWKAARAANDFPKFLPWLEKTFELNRRKAECLGVPEGGELYDALMDIYEPCMTAKQTEAIFKPLREFTVPLVQKVAEAKAAGKAPSIEPAVRPLPIDKQIQFATRVISAMGFDFEAGRMDASTHPFCQGMGPGDCRLTNRYRENGWCDALSSGTHEAGHGMYEQGLPKAERFGQPVAESVSLGIHESQSRMWENQVGRSEAFWKWALPIAREIFGAEALKGIEVQSIFKAANLIEPNFIRVESDEVTYNLHIMLRFELERAMIKGDLACKDLPGVWNERIKNDLGLTVTEDRVGCLQDIHWSMGAVGYFATYSFGNIYSAQFWNAMGRDLTDREAMIERGELGPIREWLRENIHIHGRRFPAEQLCERVTGEGMNPEHLIAYLGDKVKRVYG
jgi:carboxypeptidase Taq